MLRQQHLELEHGRVHPAFLEVHAHVVDRLWRLSAGIDLLLRRVRGVTDRRDTNVVDEQIARFEQESELPLVLPFEDRAEIGVLPFRRGRTGHDRRVGAAVAQVQEVLDGDAVIGEAKLVQLRLGLHFQVLPANQNPSNASNASR